MSILRLSGVVFGLLGLGLAGWARFHLRRLRNGDWVLASALSATLLVVGLHPGVVDVALAPLDFTAGGYGRLVGLLVVTAAVLALLVFVALARATRVEKQLDRLVREMAKREFRGAHPPEQSPIFIVIPAYNEGENIGGVLAAMPAEVCGLRATPIVVVDGATDNTAQVVGGLNARAVTCVVNRGGGSALRVGYELALERGAEIVVTLDADGQHLPEEIPRLVEPILEGRADLVNGSRVLGTFEKESEVRAAGVFLFNWLFSLLVLRRITDCSNSFRAIRADVLGKLELRQSQFHAAELLLDAMRKDYRVLEVPITIRRRQGGVSKKPPSLRYAIGFARAIVSTWLR